MKYYISTVLILIFTACSSQVTEHKIDSEQESNTTLKVIYPDTIIGRESDIKSARAQSLMFYIWLNNKVYDSVYERCSDKFKADVNQKDAKNFFRYRNLLGKHKESKCVRSYTEVIITETDTSFLYATEIETEFEHGNIIEQFDIVGTDLGANGKLDVYRCQHELNENELIKLALQQNKADLVPLIKKYARK